MNTSGSIDVQVGSDDVLITMHGDIDYYVTSDFDMVRELREARGKPMRVDLADVTFLDSRGIAQLLTARNFAPAVKLVNPPPEVTKLLAVSGITDLFSYDQAS